MIEFKVIQELEPNTEILETKVEVYLFNSIDCKIKKYIKDNKIFDNYKQMF